MFINCCWWKEAVINSNNNNKKYVSGDYLYPHMPILRPHAAQYSTNDVESPTGTFPSRTGRFIRFWGPRGSKFLKMGDSLPWMQINHHAKFILGGEIRNRTSKHTNKQ